MHVRTKAEKLLNCADVLVIAAPKGPHVFYDAHSLPRLGVALGVEPLSSKPCLGGSTGSAHRVVNELKYMPAPRIVLCAAPDAGCYGRAIRTSRGPARAPSGGFQVPGDRLAFGFCADRTRSLVPGSSLSED